MFLTFLSDGGILVLHTLLLTRCCKQFRFFQVLLKAGLLVPPDEDGPVATLAHNASGRFDDRWIYLQATPGKCPFLTGLDRLHLHRLIPLMA